MKQTIPTMGVDIMSMMMYYIMLLLLICVCSDVYCVTCALYNDQFRVHMTMCI